MIKSIYLENWKTHKDSNLEFFKGSNILLGSIGSGKSSVVDAISYGLFGNFPSLSNRKLSIAETIMFKPVKKEKANIILELEYNSNYYKIEREINFKNKANLAKIYENEKLIAGPKQSDVNKKVTDILNIDYNLFTKIVYSEQNELDYFLKIPPSKRKENFDELFGIIHFENIKEQTRKLSNILSIEIEKKNALNEQIIFQLESLDINNLKSKYNSTKDKIKFIEEELSIFLEKKKEYQESLKKEKEKKDLYDKYKLNLNTVLSKIKELDEEINTLSKLVSYKEDIKNFIDNKNKEFNELEKEINELEEKNKYLEIKYKNLNSKCDFYSKEINNLKNIKENKQNKLFKSKFTLESLFIQKKELDQKLNNKKEKYHSLSSKLQDVKKALVELNKGFAKCPVCDNILSTQEINKKINEKGIIQVNLENNISEIKKGILKINNEINDLNKLEDKLKENKLILESIKENDELLNKYSIILEDIKNQKDKLDKPIDLKEKKDYKEKLKNTLFSLNQYIEKKEKLNKLYLQKNELQEKINLLSFDENKYLTVYSDFKNINSKLSELLNNKKLYNTILLDIKKQIEIYNNLKEKMKNINLIKNKLDIKKQNLSYFLSSLDVSQFQLRKVLIDNINSALSLIWPKLYPYKDYIDARLQASKDYILEVKTLENEWIRVEGLLSGGERTCAALSIRIAIALVLTKKLGLLILDEPTHNLDSKSIEALSNLFESQLPEIVDQIFIVTHDSKLLETVNANKIIIDRDKENDGVSIIKNSS